jgi:protein gp37
MAAAGSHTFQILTKRHHRMNALLNDELRRLGSLPNVWWGAATLRTDAVDQEHLP